MQSTNASADSKTLALRAVRLLAMGAIAFTLEAFLDAYRLAALMLGAFAVELLGSKAGLKWDETGARKRLDAALLVGRGFAFGALAAVSIVGLAAAFGLVKVSLGSPSPLGLGLGLLMPFAQAARDELLFRGAPLALARGYVPDRYALPFSALLGAAPLLLVADRSPMGIAIVVVTGFAFAVAWRAGKGIFLAWGAHAGWLFMLGAGTRGSVLDVSLGAGQLLPLVHARGSVAWLALATTMLFATAAVLYMKRLLAKP